MKIRIVYFSNKPDSYISEMQDEYAKRLRAFCTMEISCLKPFSLKESNTREEVIKKEAGLLNRFINNDFLIVLDREGKEMSSIFFSKFLSSMKDQGRNITIVIGGAYGIDISIISKADLVLSLSKMTFTHAMSRVILFEQLYRVFSIMSNKEYHY